VKRLVAPIGVLSALVVLAGVLALGGTGARAQTPPARFFGALFIDGVPAPSGTVVQAFIGDLECGYVETGEEGRYVIDVASDGTVAGCGLDEAVVVFVINGVPAAETGVFQTGYFIALDLSMTTAPPAEASPGEAPPAEPPPDMPVE